MTGARGLALIVMIAGTLTLFTGCAIGPNYVRPPAEISPAYNGGTIEPPSIA